MNHNAVYTLHTSSVIHLYSLTTRVEIYYKVPDKSVKNSQCPILFHDCRTHCPTASINLISMRLIAHINSSCHAFVRNNKNYCLNSRVSFGV